MTYLTVLVIYLMKPALQVSQFIHSRQKDVLTMNAISRIPMTETPPVHDVLTLTKGGKLAQIILDGKVYQLRITKAGKLILTK